METIRAARVDDLPAILAIYNHYVAQSTCTYQIQPDTLAERSAWFDAHGAAHPVTVAVNAGAVVGWGSLGPFRHQQAYARTVENSVYVHHQHHRRGIGSRLLADLVERARGLGHHVVVALISADQEASVRLHERAGFSEAGRLREVGHKFGRWLDVLSYHLLIA
ncbi:MAG: N-acetyltransferase [Planctomycetes bacterium]|nr:N-acetyltransferase [Planctomycetota bacterium]